MHAPFSVPLVDELARGRLRWFPELGVGFYPVEDPAAPYDDAYFEKYRGYAVTDLGRQITEFRIEFVDAHIGPARTIVDNGIGCGHFIEMRDAYFERRRTFGFDINPRARQWLEGFDRLIDPNRVPVPALSMFDVLEHIEDFRPLLANVLEWLFVSVPIFDDCAHVLRSRHYRKDEHFWHFTDRGFRGMMAACGFEVVAMSTRETELGRDQIFTYAMRRTHAVGSLRT